MTDDLAAVAAAVDAAVPARTRSEWMSTVRQPTVPMVSRGVYRPCGTRVGYLVRCSTLPVQSTPAPGPQPFPGHDGAATQALRNTFRELGTQSPTDTVFVRATRDFLAGELPVPRHPERVVVEIDATEPWDTVVCDGLLRLKVMGCRVSLADFTGRSDQRRMLAFADYVKLDARDLDVEGGPLLAVAGSRGAQLVADFVDTAAVLRACRAAGFSLVQGRALETPVSSSGARVLSAAWH
jgi:c-di-GMP phosphodiesterase